MLLLENFWEQARKYLFPVYCLRCGLEGDWLCQFCESLCPPVPIQRCIFCQSIASHGETCVVCRRRHDLDGLIVRGIYGNWIWRNLIRTWKYKGAEELSVKCARYLEECLDFLPIEKPFIVIPIPLARLRERERGFNQATVLAESVSGHLSLPIILALKRVRETAPQSKLSPDKRLDNVKDCFKFVDSYEIKDKNCLIIDDIITTGATMDAAAKELKRAGALNVWGLALVRSEANIY